MRPLKYGMANSMSRFSQERLFSILSTCIVSTPFAPRAAPGRRPTTGRRAPPRGRRSATRRCRLKLSYLPFHWFDLEKASSNLSCYDDNERRYDDHYPKVRMHHQKY